MRVCIPAVLLVLSACGGTSGSRPFSSSEGPPKALASAGAAAATQAVEELKLAGVVDTENVLKNGSGKRAFQNAPTIVELRIDSSNPMDMKRLVPYLVNDEEWQVVGVTSRGSIRWWRFMRMGPSATRIDIFGRDKDERYVDWSELGPFQRKGKSGSEANKNVKQGLGVKKTFNPYNDD